MRVRADHVATSRWNRTDVDSGCSLRCRQQCRASIVALIPLVAHAIVKERAIAMPSPSSPDDGARSGAAGPRARKKRGRDDDAEEDEELDDNEAKHANAKQRGNPSSSAVTPNAKKKKTGGIKAALQGFQASFGISSPPVKTAPTPTRNKTGAAAGAAQPIDISSVRSQTDRRVPVNLACS